MILLEETWMEWYHVTNSVLNDWLVYLYFYRTEAFLPQITWLNQREHNAFDEVDEVKSCLLKTTTDNYRIQNICLWKFMLKRQMIFKVQAIVWPNRKSRWINNKVHSRRLLKPVQSLSYFPSSKQHLSNNYDDRFVRYGQTEIWSSFPKLIWLFGGIENKIVKFGLNEESTFLDPTKQISSK